MTYRLLTILIVLLAIPVQAQHVRHAVQRFDEGNRSFQEGDFETALASYLEAEASGYVSGALYFNMGNAHFRLDEMGEAIRHYEKARVWMPNSAELAHNLVVAQERTVDTFSRLPDPFWRMARHRLGDVLSPAALYVLGLLFYTASAGALAVRIRRGKSPWLRRIAAVGGVLAVCFVGLGIGSSYERARDVRAVVLADAVRLLEQPNGAASEVDIHEGTMVDVLATRGAWSEIRLPNGVRGWIQVEAYGTI
jgi:tetratricopeptide (TPR) repeat protein